MKKIVVILVLLIILSSVIWADLGDELYIAVDNGDINEVIRLLDLGVDANTLHKGMPVLIRAAEKRNEEIVEILL